LTKKTKLIKASERKCCKCKKKQAVAWWPVVDPDIQSWPYCRDCLDAVKLAAMIAFYEMENGPRSKS
jgi:hypothetical protein